MIPPRLLFAAASVKRDVLALIRSHRDAQLFGGAIDFHQLTRAWRATYSNVCKSIGVSSCRHVPPAVDIAIASGLSETASHLASCLTGGSHIGAGNGIPS